MIERTCEHCGASFKVSSWFVKRGWGRFCARACRYAAMKGENAPNWRGGVNHHPAGYRRVTLEGKGTVAEHRHVMEEHLGHALPSNVHVHHLNGDKTDNRIENLAVMSAAEHLRVERDLHGRWSKKHDACIDCGQSTMPHHGFGRCAPCYHKHRNAHISTRIANGKST